MNKEQLQEKIGELKNENSRLKVLDENIREEFAKAFGWEKPNNSYYRETEFEKRSWEQIFVEVGRLLNEQSVSGIIEENKELRDFLEETEEILGIGNDKIPH